MGRLDVSLYGSLDVIETTSERNGYPANIKYAIIGFDTYEEAKRFADETGMQVQYFERRDGWQLWYRTGNNAYGEYEIGAEIYGENYSEYSSEEEYMYILNDLISSGVDDIEELENIVKNARYIIDDIRDLEDDEVVITRCGYYYGTIKKHSMYYYHDTHHYAIGVI